MQPIESAAIYFWGPGCETCSSYGPIYDLATSKLEGQLPLRKINIEEEHSAKHTYLITSLPTLIVFQNGKEISRQSGAVPLQPLVQWLYSFVRFRDSYDDLKAA